MAFFVFDSDHSNHSNHSIIHIYVYNTDNTDNLHGNKNWNGAPAIIVAAGVCVYRLSVLKTAYAGPKATSKKWRYDKLVPC